jgi:nitrite reductase/ring-hydroxylating ferredoxin subunit
VIRVAALDELTVGRARIFEAGERQVLLVRTDDAVYATEAICPHARSVLGPSRLTDEGYVECPMHGARFSPADGCAHKGPTRQGLETYPVEVVDGQVHVDFAAARPRPPAPRWVPGTAATDKWDAWSPAAFKTTSEGSS